MTASIRSFGPSDIYERAQQESVKTCRHTDNPIKRLFCRQQFLAQHEKCSSAHTLNEVSFRYVLVFLAKTVSRGGEDA